MFLKKSWLAALFHWTTEINLDLLGQENDRTFSTRHLKRLIAHIFQNWLSQFLRKAGKWFKVLNPIGQKVPVLQILVEFEIVSICHFQPTSPSPPSDRRPEYITKLAHFELNPPYIYHIYWCGLKQMEYVTNFSNDAKQIFLQLFFLTIVQINVCLTFFLGETLNLPSESLTLCSQRHTEQRIAAVMRIISTAKVLLEDCWPMMTIHPSHSNPTQKALQCPKGKKMTFEGLGRPPMN